MGSYVLTTGGIIDIWGGPVPLKFWPSTAGRSLVAGDTVTLKVEVPNPARSITWSHNDIELPGQTNQSLVLSNIQPHQSGFYTARVTASIGSMVFSGATTSITSLEVTPRPRLEDAARDMSGIFTARIRGVTNRSVAIESSTDLRRWTRGPVRWLNGGFCTGNTVTNPPLFGPQLFYRAVVLP